MGGVSAWSPDEALGRQALRGEAPNGEQGAVDRKGWDDRVDARPVRQAGIDHRRAVIDHGDRRH